MDIYAQLRSLIPRQEYPVRSLVIGCYWILFSSRYAGLASCLREDDTHGHSRIRDAGNLHKKSANEIAEWIDSENLLEASLGMAALNSLLEVDESQTVELNAAEVIARHSRGKNLAIVGHFPFVERMAAIAHNCWVIEQHPTGTDHPAEAAPDLLPQAHVIAITGTALINHTMHDLLSYCAPEALVLVLGPSTPLSPLLFPYGISFLSGSRVTDEDAAYRTVSQGAIFPQVQGVRLLTLTRPGVVL